MGLLVAAVVGVLVLLVVVAVLAAVVDNRANFGRWLPSRDAGKDEGASPRP